MLKWVSTERINYGFYIEMPSLVSLIISIVFNDSFGVRTVFLGLVNEIWEVERVLIQP